jgi:hypothetical protein
LFIGCCAVSETPAVCVWTQAHRPLVPRHALRSTRPDAAGRAVLRDLLEQVDVRVEEERQAGGEPIELQPA